MSILNIMKMVFDESADAAQLREVLRKLNEKESEIENLKKRMEMLELEVLFLTMEHYTLSHILKQVQYRSNYQQKLESQLDEILVATVTFGHFLENVEWHKIINYDAMFQSGRRREFKKMNQEMQEVYNTMENRKIVKEFRTEQKNLAMIQDLFEKTKRALSLKKKRMQSDIESALQNRNKVILQLVLGSKTLVELRQRLLQRPSNNRIEINSIQNIFSRFLKTDNDQRTEPIKESVNNQLMRPMQSGVPCKSPIQTYRDPLKSVFDFHFNEINFEIIQQDNDDKKQKASSPSSIAAEVNHPEKTEKLINLTKEGIDSDIFCEDFPILNDTGNEKKKTPNLNEKEVFDKLDADIFYEMRQEICEEGDRTKLDEFKVFENDSKENEKTKRISKKSSDNFTPTFEEFMFPSDMLKDQKKKENIAKNTSPHNKHRHHHKEESYTSRAMQDTSNKSKNFSSSVNDRRDSNSDFLFSVDEDLSDSTLGEGGKDKDQQFSNIL